MKAKLSPNISLKKLNALAFGRSTFTMDCKNAFEPFSLSLNIRIKRDHIIIVFNPVQ
ncbi:hypothetical protein HpDR43_04830 [Helicobacter pylori]